MHTLTTPLLLLCLVPADDKPFPPFPVSKETTYLLAPFDKEGYIDYEAALNKRLGEGITPEKNAVVLLWKAFGRTSSWQDSTVKPMPPDYFKRLAIEEPSKEGSYFIALRTYRLANLKPETEEFTSLEEQFRLAQERPWQAKDHPHLAAWLKANDKALSVAIEASRRPNYFNPVICRRTDYGRGPLLAPLLENVFRSRALAEALIGRALLRVGAGQFDDAWQDLLACHRLGRLIARGGTLIEGLIGLAIERV